MREPWRSTTGIAEVEFAEEAVMDYGEMHAAIRGHQDRSSAGRTGQRIGGKLSVGPLCNSYKIDRTLKGPFSSGQLNLLFR
jgi:hypothetical protein